MLGRPTDAALALGHTFAAAVAEFVTTGAVNGWPLYTPAAAAARIRHFS
jgi:hypothetical protein